MNISSLVDFWKSGGERASIRARWVFPGVGPPLENGTVEITAGRIAAVHDRVGPVTCDLGNAAVIPGLVNAHTHLELSDVQAPLGPAHLFTTWLQQVMAHRRDRVATAAPGAAPPGVQAVVAGRSESTRLGTTTLGDIVSESAPAEVASDSQPHTVAFLELLGLAPERQAAQLARACEHLTAGGSLVRGLSPHAPYSVHPDLLRGAVDLAVVYRAPVAMHLAETEAELELLKSGSGEFVEFLERLGVWRAAVIPRGSRPLDSLRELARAERALAIHGNYLDDDEIEFLAAHPSISVVYCPRTHAYFGHAPHPWRKLLGRGINVAIGTDSRASNPDLSLFAELQFLRRLAPDFDPARLLQLGTIGSAAALGIERETGSLEAGKSADLAIVALPEASGCDPYSLLFDPAAHVVATLISGRLP
ncbi:MAG: amidohydrolase family protein [Planctomycetia bacterium]|nr:amidohydrolase family protein [Planctomycetia bacterium]